MVGIPIGVVLVGIIGFSFYWWEWRPSNARKVCGEKYNYSAVLREHHSVISVENVKLIMDATYKLCMTGFGVQE